MSKVTPNVQARNQHPKDWGSYATLDVLPNAANWAGGANPADPLEDGDTAFVTTSGIGPVYCVSAGTPGGLDAVWARIGAENVYEGFQTSNLADYYRVPAASGGTTCPGADDFIFVVMVTPFTVRDGALSNFIAQNAGAAGGAARGWRIHWNGTGLEGTCYVTGPAAVQAVTGTTAYSSSFGKLGHIHPIALRVYQSGGNTVVELWEGPARVATATGAATVLPANNAADQMRLGSGVFFGSEASLNGGCYGAAYYEGTRTDDEMRALMGRCYTELRIPDDVAWDNRWQGADVVTAPASWVATDGGVDLEQVGAPTGSSAYFPPA